MVPMDPVGSRSSNGRVPGRGEAHPISGHIVWLAIGRWCQIPASDRRVSHQSPILSGGVEELTLAAMMSNWNFSQ